MFEFWIILIKVIGFVFTSIAGVHLIIRAIASGHQEDITIVAIIAMGAVTVITLLLVYNI